MNVAITGSHGFVGTALVERLRAEGHRAVRLVRTAPAGSDEVAWNPAAGEIDASGLEGLDGVVHLAGVGIGTRRWTEQHKARILDSRVRGTRLLSETLAGLNHKPTRLVSASGVDYYGDRGDEVLTESSSQGTGFLAEVCEQWESSTSPAADAGITVWRIRSGIILGHKGGALPKMLIPFRLGVGGKLGSGRQYLPWITIDDHISAIMHLLSHEGDGGPVNLATPEPVRNEEFARVAGHVLARPAFVPAPAFALKLVLGGAMASGLLLASKRVIPERLTAQGFTFRWPQLEPALRHVLGKEST